MENPKNFNFLKRTDSRHLTSPKVIKRSKRTPRNTTRSSIKHNLQLITSPRRQGSPQTPKTFFLKNGLSLGRSGSNPSLPNISNSINLSACRIKKNNCFELNSDTYSMMTGKKWKKSHNILTTHEDSFVKIKKDKSSQDLKFDSFTQIASKRGPPTKHHTFKNNSKNFTKNLEKSGKIELGVERLMGKKYKKTLLGMLTDVEAIKYKHNIDFVQGDIFISEYQKK